MHIKVSQIDKLYGSETVLNDISFDLHTDSKIGLVGNNGTGKSTLLRILAGEVEIDGGEITGLSDCIVGYVPQDIALVTNKTIREYLGVYEDTQDYQMEKVMAGLGLSEFPLDTPIAELSSGQKSKIFLAQMLIKEPDLLLLDEPTNNLDMPALVWLEQFLKQTRSAFVVVSHDRKFLDSTISKIFEIDWHTKKLTVTHGRYSDFLIRKEAEFQTQVSKFNREQKELARLDKLIDSKRGAVQSGSSFRGSDNDKYLRGFKRDRSARSGAAIRALEKRKERTSTVDKPVSRDPFHVALTPEKPVGNADISFEDAKVGYPDGFSISDINLHIPYGSRLVILGNNGVGKSTILKSLSGELEPLEGSVSVGGGLVVGNFTQEHQNLLSEKPLLEYLMDKTGLKENEVFALVKKFGFSTDEVRKKIIDFSPGGRARLSLALFSVRSVNLLLLDEPTNHLDLEALIAVESLVAGFTGTIVLVSHDRFFLQKYNPTHVYLLKDGKLSKTGSVEDYIKAAWK